MRTRTTPRSNLVVATSKYGRLPNQHYTRTANSDDLVLVMRGDLTPFNVVTDGPDTEPRSDTIQDNLSKKADDKYWSNMGHGKQIQPRITASCLQSSQQAKLKKVHYMDEKSMARSGRTRFLLHMISDYSERVRQLQEAVAGLSSRRDRFLEIGRLLREFYDELPTGTLKKSLVARIAASSGIGVRTAYHWIEIDRVYPPLHVPRERLVSIGWAKLKLIARHVNPQTYLEWLEIAEAHSFMELKCLVGGGKGSRRSMVLTFSPPEYAVVKKALAAYGASIQGGGRTLIGKEEALLRICGLVLMKSL